MTLESFCNMNSNTNAEPIVIDKAPKGKSKKTRKAKKNDENQPPPGRQLAVNLFGGGNQKAPSFQSLAEEVEESPTNDEIAVIPFSDLSNNSGIVK